MVVVDVVIFTLEGGGGGGGGAREVEGEGGGAEKRRGEAEGGDRTSQTPNQRDCRKVLRIAGHAGQKLKLLLKM